MNGFDPYQSGANTNIAPSVLTPAAQEEYTTVQNKKKQDLSNRLKSAQDAFRAVQGDDLTNEILSTQRQDQGVIEPRREEKGNFAGHLYNKLLQGTGSLANAVTDVALNAGKYLPTGDPYVESGQIIKDYRKEGSGKVREFLKEQIGANVDKGLARKYDEGLVTGALGGLAESVPAMIGSGATGGASLFAQMYDAGLQSIEAQPGSEKLDEDTKTIYAASIGLITSALEKYGLDKVLKGSGVVNAVFNKILKSSEGKKISGDVLGEMIDENVKGLARRFAKGGVRAVDAFTTEFGTGASQEVATDISERLLDKATGEPIFDTSKKEDWGKFLNRIGRAGVQEGIGGGVLGGGIGFLTPGRKKTVQDKQNLVTQIDEKLQDPELPEETKEVLSQRKSAIVTEIEDEVDAEADHQEKIAPEALMEAHAINSQLDKVEIALADETITPEIKKDLEGQAKQLNKELEDVVVKGQATQEILLKAEDDLEALKQVENKTKKYEGSIKRLTEAKKAGTITENQFNELKTRFDDVIAESKPTVEDVTVEEEVQQEPSGETEEVVSEADVETPVEENVSLINEGDNTKETVVEKVTELKEKPKAVIEDKVEELQSKPKVTDKELKAQKKDMLDQLSEVESVIDTEDTESSLKSIKDLGYSITDKGQITFEVEGDGTFKIHVDNIGDAIKEVQKQFPDKNPQPKDYKPKLSGANGKGKTTVTQTELDDMKENLATATKSGNVKLQEVFTKELERLNKLEIVEPKSKEDATSITSTESLDVGESSGDGRKMGEGDAKEKTSTKSESPDDAGRQDAQKESVKAEPLEISKEIKDAGFDLAYAKTPKGKYRIVEVNSQKPIGKLYDTKEELVEAYEANKDKLTPELLSEVTGKTLPKGDYDYGDVVKFTDKIGEESEGKIIDYTEGRYIIEKPNGIKEVVRGLHINSDPVPQDMFQDRNNKKASERIQVKRTPQSTSTKKLNKMISELVDALKTPLIYAKSKRKNSLGTYNPSNALVNVRNAGDIDTIAHEIGHLVDDRFDLLGNSTQAVKDQLKWFYDRGGSNPPKGISKTQKQSYLQREGLAEFIRAYIANPSEAKAVAPELYDFFEQTVNKETLDAIKNFSKDYIDFANAPAGDQILSNILETPDLKEKKTVVDWLKERSNKEDHFSISWADNLKSHVSDSMHAAKKAFEYAKNMKGIGTLLPEKDFETMARLFAGVNGKIDRIFEGGMIDSKNKFLKDSKGNRMTIKWLFDPLDTTSKKTLEQESKEVIQYMVAQRTVEYAKKFGRNRNLSGIGGGIKSDLSVATEYLDGFEDMRQTHPDKAERIEEAARRYREYADAGLKYALDKGRLSQEQYDAIKDGNKYYVSMARVGEVSPEQEPLAFVNQFGKGGLTSVKEVVKKAKGGTGLIQNPYISLLKNTSDLINESDRNEVMQNFVSVLTENRDMGQGEVKALSEIGRQVQSGEKNTKTIFIDGKPQKWQFHEDVYKALTGMEGLKTIPSLLRMPGQLLRWSVTHFPSFAVKNLIRDTQARLIQSRSDGSVRDLTHNLSDREMFDLYGGSQAGFHLKSREAYYDTMKAATKELTEKGGIVLDPRKIGGLANSYAKFLEKSENVNRIAEFKSAFKQAKKNGMDDYNAGLYAAYQGRDLLDFAVAGHTIKTLNQIMPFTNAAVQGLKRTIQGATENPKAFAIKTAVYSIIPQVLTRALVHSMGDDDEYEQLPWYQRDLFYNFKTPLTGDKWISIPKPFDLGLISSGLDRGISLAMGKKNGFEGYGKSFYSVASPVDESTLIPFLKPLVEIMSNHDIFRDAPIVPEWEEDLMLSKRSGTKYASNLGKKLSEAFGMVGSEVDPRYIDHAIKGFASYYGDAAIRTSNIGSQDGKKFGWEQTGLIRERPIANSKDVLEAYELSEKLGKSQSKEVKQLRETVKAFYASDNVADRDKYSKQAYEEAKVLRTKLEKEYAEEPDRDKTYDDLPSAFKTIEKGGRTFDLTNSQIEERIKANEDFIERHGEKILYRETRKALRDGKSPEEAKITAEKELESQANSESRELILKKYRNGKNPDYQLKERE